MPADAPRSLERASLLPLWAGCLVGSLLGSGFFTGGVVGFLLLSVPCVAFVETGMSIYEVYDLMLGAGVVGWFAGGGGGTLLTYRLVFGAPSPARRREALRVAALVLLAAPLPMALAGWAAQWGGWGPAPLLVPRTVAAAATATLGTVVVAAAARAAVAASETGEA